MTEAVEGVTGTRVSGVVVVAGVVAVVVVVVAEDEGMMMTMTVVGVTIMVASRGGAGAMMMIMVTREDEEAVDTMIDTTAVEVTIHHLETLTVDHRATVSHPLNRLYLVPK